MEECRLPIGLLSKITLIRFGNFLNSPKIFKTEDGELRDWRGLQDQAKLNFEEKSRVSGSRNKTVEIIILWSKKQTISFISIGDLWRALTKIERHDVQQHLLDQVNHDIQRYQRLIGAANISLEDQLEITRTRRDILTLEDITSVHEGGTVTQFDAMVLNGQEDEGFADHIVERMKEIGLKIFYPQIDLIAGWI